jgi:hypothetical protein
MKKIIADLRLTAVATLVPSAEYYHPGWSCLDEQSNGNSWNWKFV